MCKIFRSADSFSAHQPMDAFLAVPKSAKLCARDSLSPPRIRRLRRPHHQQHTNRGPSATTIPGSDTSRSAMQACKPATTSLCEQRARSYADLFYEILPLSSLVVRKALQALPSFGNKPLLFVLLSVFARCLFLSFALA